MASRGNILQRIVRLVWDRNAARKAESDSKRAVGTMDTALQSLKRQALAVGAAFVAAFSFTKIVGGIRESIRAFVEADKIWNRLAGTLETVGVGFGSVESQVRAAARAMQDTTTVGDEEFAETLQTLIAITGDYDRSLAAVSTTADLAAGLQLDLAAAAKLVGRAMVGETGTLSRYGIIVREGADAVEQIRTQFAGLAANEARTLGGRLTMLGNEWGDLKEAIGEAMIDATNGASIVDQLTESLKRMSQWVVDNGPEIRDFWSGLLDLLHLNREGLLKLERLWLLQQLPARMLGGQRDRAAELRDRLREINAELREIATGVDRIRLPGETDIAGDILRLEANAAAAAERALQKAAEERAAADIEALKAAGELEKARQQEIQLLVEAAEKRMLTTDEAERLFDIERELRSELAAGIPDLERRLRIAKELAAAGGAAQGLRNLAQPTPRLADPSMPGGLIPGPTSVQPIFGETVKKSREELLEFVATMEEVEARSVRLAGSMTDAFTGLFLSMEEGSVGVGEFIVGQLMAGFAAYLEVMAAAEFAKALIPGVQSFAHIAAGVALSAAAGGARALESSLRRGGSGGRASVSAGGGGLSAPSSRLDQTPADITVVLQGDFDALNPKFVRAVHTANTEGIQTIGRNVRVVTRP
jgi:hypothetical protein